MKKTLTKRLIIINIIVLASAFAVSGGAFGYWDRLSGSGGGSFNIGEWETVPSDDDFYAYLNESCVRFNSDSGVPYDMSNYIKSLLLDDSGVIKEDFESYQPQHKIRLVDAVIESMRNFVKVSDNGTPYLPEKKNVGFVPLNFGKDLQSGTESQYGMVAFLTANRSAENHWSPVTIEITMEGSGDISDYAVEVLYQAPLGGKEPLGFSYMVTDHNVYNVNFATGQYENNLVIQAPATEGIEMLPTYLNKGNGYQKSFLKYNIEAALYPTFYRLSKVQNIMIDRPSRSNPLGVERQPLAIDYSLPERNGLWLRGLPDGRKTSMKVSFQHRNKNDNVPVPIIPLILRVARAESAVGDGAGIPKIMYRVVDGDIWS